MQMRGLSWHSVRKLPGPGKTRKARGDLRPDKQAIKRNLIKKFNRKNIIFNGATMRWWLCDTAGVQAHIIFNTIGTRTIMRLSCTIRGVHVFNYKLGRRIFM